MATGTSLLSAINTMLTAIGETPINSLSGNTTATVSIAQNILETESRRFQAKGWHFNTDYEYSLVPDSVTQYISIPENVVSIDVRIAKYAAKYDPVIRAGKLYDRNEHTFLWTETIKVDITWLFDFADLPEAARQYVMIRSARIFAERILGSELIASFTIRDEEMAYADFRNYNGEQADYNIFNNGDVSAPLVRNFRSNY